MMEFGFVYDICSEISFSIVRWHSSIHFMKYINSRCRVTHRGGKEIIYSTVYCSGFKRRNTIKYDEFPAWVLHDRVWLNENPLNFTSRQQNNDINIGKSRYCVDLEETKKSSRHRVLLYNNNLYFKEISIELEITRNFEVPMT